MTDTKLKEDFFSLKDIVTTEIRLLDTSKNSHLQNYLYFAFYPLFNFAESILILCQSGKNHSAKVLLRSLFEAHINIIYHQLGNTEHKLSVSAKSGFDSKIKGIRELKDIIRMYPNLQSDDPKNLFNREWLENAEKWAVSQRDVIIKSNNLSENNQDLDLKAKAIKCDKEYTQEIEKGHFQRLYSVVYRQLSPASHLNIEGLQTFVDKNEIGEYLFDDGKDGQFICEQAIEICLVFTKDLYEHGVIKTDIPDVVHRIEKILSSRYTLPPTHL